MAPRGWTTARAKQHFHVTAITGLLLFGDVYVDVCDCLRKHVCVFVCVGIRGERKKARDRERERERERRAEYKVVIKRERERERETKKKGGWRGRQIWRERERERGGERTKSD